FERAAHWYRAALAEREDRQARIGLADALSSSGNGREAAEIYLALLDGAAQEEALDLKRRAATEFLISGRTREGLDLLHSVLQAIGVKLHASAMRALPSLLMHRARIQLRGLDAAMRGEVDRGVLTLADAVWSATRGLSMVDTLRAAELHSRTLVPTL